MPVVPSKTLNHITCKTVQCPGVHNLLQPRGVGSYLFANSRLQTYKVPQLPPPRVFARQRCLHKCESLQCASATTPLQARTGKPAPEPALESASMSTRQHAQLQHLSVTRCQHLSEVASQKQISVTTRIMSAYSVSSTSKKLLGTSA